MQADVRGYYAALGVSASASATEIKTAYRRLAKLHHPDGGGSRDDAAIKKINEAYGVLKDPSRRAAYDSDSIAPKTAETAQAKQVPPLRCSKCHKITAQVRYLIFWRVYSLILMTGRTPVQGLFCAICAKREAMNSTIFTSLLGWWGIPWGPIWTLANGIQNATGGHQEQDRNEALTWYNVVAFMQAKQIPIAYGLAERLLRANNQQVRTAAIDFTALCRSHGFSPTGELKDSWSIVRAQLFLRCLILAAVPVFLTALIFFSSTSATNSDYPSYADVSTNYPSDSTSLGVESLAAPTTAANEPKIIPCARTPDNAQLLYGRHNLKNEGHKLTIDNGTDGNAIVKVRRADNSLYASFFVQKGMSASIEGISDGTYKIQYAIGDTLDSTCKTFGHIDGVNQFPQTETLSAEYINDYRGEGYMYDELSYTLYSVPGGNVHPDTISQEQFDAH